MPLFGDRTPFQLVSEESLAAVGEEAAKGDVSSTAAKVDHRRFRPNLVVSGVTAGPFAEDAWALLRLGEEEGSAAVLRTCCLSPRCELINLDPDLGAKVREGQPLKALRSFR